MNIKFYLIWTDGQQSFDPKRQFEDTEFVFRLEIHEKEGQIPKAHLLIEHSTANSVNNRRHHHAWIVAEVVQNQFSRQILLFSGQVSSAPSYMDGSLIEIVLTPKYDQGHQKLKDLKTSLKVPPFFDDLFALKDSRDNLQELLDARACLIYYSRTDHDIKISDVLWGSQSFKLGARFFTGTLDFYQQKEPLSAVTFTMKAEWMQTFQGRTNVSYAIRSRFSKGLVNTLTGQDLEKKWWKSGDKIQSSCYWIEYSALKEIKPFFTGILDFYPRASQKFKISPVDPANKTRQVVTTSFKRSWYRCRLVLGWIYQQKRCESVKFTLKHKTQLSNIHPSRVRHIKLNLQPVHQEDGMMNVWSPHHSYKKNDVVLNQGDTFFANCNHVSSHKFERDQAFWSTAQNQSSDHGFEHHSASFFTTPRGQMAIQHALEIAQAHLSASARALEIRFQARFEEFMEMTCDHSVWIEDERLPGGSAWGKIKALKLIVDGATGKLWADITLGCSVGCGRDKIELDATPTFDQYCHFQYFDDGYLKQDQTNHSSPSNIHYRFVESAYEIQGIKEPQLLTAADIIEDVHIINSSDQQNELLQKFQYPYHHSIQSILGQMPTDVILKLKDLRSRPLLRHTINLQILEPWSADHQVNLQNFNGM